MEQKNLCISEEKISFFKNLKLKEDSIRNGNLDELITFCENNKIILIELKTDLNQKSNIQIFISHCTNKKMNRAMQFIRNNGIVGNKIKEWFFLLVKDPSIHKEKNRKSS